MMNAGDRRAGRTGPAFCWGRPIVLLIVALAATGCFNDPVSELAVWSEFLPPQEVSGQLPALARFEADLYLAVQPDELGEDLLVLLREAETQGVGVRLWPQLPDLGIWVNETNAVEFGVYVFELLEWAAANDVSIEWIIFDLEPSLEYAEQLRGTFGEEGLTAVLDLLAAHRTPEDFEVARLTVAEIVEQLHSVDVRAMTVTLPWTIDDLADNDPDLQDIFDTPLAGIGWDKVSVMAYRPWFSDFLGVPLSPGFVGSYAASVAARFPGRAQVAIGNISSPGLLLPQGYSDPFEVTLDVSAARSAGVTDVSLYSLDGMVLAGGAERWLAAASGPTLALNQPDLLTLLMRQVFSILDQALSVAE
ncbi:MAG TPA: hypothetical protein VMZ31_08745 [Phycisphaerae bacterium]|nr:hypothetical protein [Phycisphaerae bacterium]